MAGVAEYLPGDPKFREEIGVDDNGFASGLREYLVRGAASYAEAIAASGLPTRGVTPFDAEHPLALCRSLSASILDGTYHIVRAQYRELPTLPAGGGGEYQPARASLRFTELRREPGSETVHAFWAASGVGQAMPGGQGVPVPLYTTSAIVEDHRTSPLAIDAVLGHDPSRAEDTGRGVLNALPITLPPRLNGVGGPIGPFAAGTLVYLGTDEDASAEGIVRYRHHFRAARTFDAFVPQFDAAGNQIATFFGPVMPSVDLSFLQLG